MAEQFPADNREFGKYLRRIREERRLSLDAVEEMSLAPELPERVTKSHLSRIENGQAIPTFPRMFTLSQIYGVPVSFLAERFELSLRRGTFPPELVTRPAADVRKEAHRLRLSGRYVEALMLYESLVMRDTEDAPAEQATVDLRLECVNCLVKLSREVTAKEECEKILGAGEITPRQRIVTLQYFAICCYRLGKYTVAMMALEKAHAELEPLAAVDDLRAYHAALRGNLLFVTKRFADSASAYGVALNSFEALQIPFEVCRTKLNLASALIEMGSRTLARNHLREALEQSERSGYDRQRAFAYSHMALLAFRDNDLDAAEKHCIRSNSLARPREYLSILFRNCYYLWRVARERKDVAAVRANERTLRTYVSRVEEHMPEAEEFKVFLGGGSSDE